MERKSEKKGKIKLGRDKQLERRGRAKKGGFKRGGGRINSAGNVIRKMMK